MSMSAVLSLLRQHEKCFVEEIDRISNRPELVRIVPVDLENEKSGWVYLQGEPGSADWNMARLIGDLSLAMDWIDRLPQQELQLLCPPECLLSNAWKKIGTIHWYESSLKSDSKPGSAPVEVFDSMQLKPDLVCHRSNDSGSGFAIYLNSASGMQGYIKCIHSTENYFEFYIELKPDMRDKGLGTALLQMAISESHRRNKTLIYSLASDNTASMRIAHKAGLKPYMTLNRFVKAHDPKSGMYFLS